MRYFNTRISLAPGERASFLLEARSGSYWDAGKIGLSPPLIETPRGWLMLYHGVRRTARTEWQDTAGATGFSRRSGAASR